MQNAGYSRWYQIIHPIYLDATKNAFPSISEVELHVKWPKLTTVRDPHLTRASAR